jgi:hypothetical protein
LNLAAIPAISGVFMLADASGRVLLISGVDDLARGIATALAEPGSAGAESFLLEPAPLFSQRESELLARFARQHGHLPPGNDLGDELFANDLLSEDLVDDEASGDHIE